jgi:hypothetical protein
MHMKKDTYKIKTNPKYLCLDQGSDDGNGDDLKAEDFEQLSSKEMNFRETIIKFEQKKKRKEKRMLEKQQKKSKSANGGPSDDGSGGSGEGGSNKQGSADGEDEEDEDESESKSAASEDSDSKDGQQSGSKDDSKMKKRTDADGVSSIQNKQTKAQRNLFILRKAIDEKFIP